jgi:hypothetical protein
MTHRIPVSAEVHDPRPAAISPSCSAALRPSARSAWCPARRAPTRWSGWGQGHADRSRPDIAQVLTAAQARPGLQRPARPLGRGRLRPGRAGNPGLPYTHSGVLASALAMDKAKAKAVLAAAGVIVPGGGLYNRHDVARDHVMQPPYVVKPNAEGSSVGVFIVHEGANRPPRELASPDWTFGEEVMVEPYIRGWNWRSRSWVSQKVPGRWRSPISARPQVSMTMRPSTRKAARSTSCPPRSLTP